MPSRTAPATKRAATKTTAKKVAAKPQPAPTPNGDEPLIRIAFGAEDLERLINHIEGWDDPVAHRLRLRFSKHRQRHA